MKMMKRLPVVSFTCFHNNILLSSEQEEIPRKSVVTKSWANLGKNEFIFNCLFIFIIQRQIEIVMRKGQK